MRAEEQNVTGEVERDPTAQVPPSEDQSEQYSLAKILGIWALAAVPMAALSWIAFPLLAPGFGADDLPPARRSKPGSTPLFRPLCRQAGLCWRRQGRRCDAVAAGAAALWVASPGAREWAALPPRRARGPGNAHGGGAGRCGGAGARAARDAARPLRGDRPAHR